MIIQFDRAKWQQDNEGLWLSLRAVYPAQAKEFCECVEQKIYDAVLKEHHDRRSLDANAYFWMLAGKLGAKLNISPEEVYRQYIRDISGNYVIQPVRVDMIDRWNRIWCSGHIGRMIDDLGECRHTPGYHNIRCYLGSSDYDSAQMSRLIDLIVEDCKLQGIPTDTPEQLAKIKEAW